MNDGQAASFYEMIRIEDAEPGEYAQLEVEIVGDLRNSKKSELLPARVIITASDGSHPDGSGFGVYADGRFFTEGRFTVTVPFGRTEFLVKSGPNYVPLHANMDLQAGKKHHIQVSLYRWFSPEERGWYGGDNHVHSQHDETAKITTGLAYTALQGRANGLSFLTEAGSNVSYDAIGELSTDFFLLEYASEIRTGNYAGHLNTPGISCPIRAEELAEIERRPLPTQGIISAAHRLGGVVIYTHPLTPPHQLHWMGATEVFSDAVIGQYADAFDIDSEITQLLWFSLLNLGLKLAASSYTDSALERLHTLSPGDRRVYCRADAFNYSAIIDALREGRTFVTNGGPLFAFFTIDESQPGDSLFCDERLTHTAQVEIHSMYALKKAELYRRGHVEVSFVAEGQQGETRFRHEFQEREKSWYVLRVEDERGNWCMTSPIYFEPCKSLQQSFAHCLLFEIANHSRFAELRQQFFAHMIVTVSNDDSIAEVQLLKDGYELQKFTPEIGNRIASGRTPVTELAMGGDYEPGWVWVPESGSPVHFQADWPIVDSGWYSIRFITSGGKKFASDKVFFDQSHPNSHALSLAHLSGEDTRFDLWGYGEEMPLEQIGSPQGDHWWYPDNTAWRVKASFGEQEYQNEGKKNKEGNDPLSSFFGEE